MVTSPQEMLNLMMYVMTATPIGAGVSTAVIIGILAFAWRELRK